MSRRAGLGELPSALRRQVKAQPGELIGARLGEQRRAAAAAGAPAVVPPAGPLPQGAGVVRANIQPLSYQTVAGSARYAAENLARLYIAIQNNSAADLWFNFQAAAGLNVGFRLPANGFFEEYYLIPTGAIYVWAAAAGGAFTLAEG